LSEHTLLKNMGTATISNLASGVLSPTTFEAAQLHYDTLLDENGRKMMMKPTKLIVPPALRSTALQLLKASGWVWNEDLGTSVSGSTNKSGMTNMLNSANPSNGFYGSWTPMVSHFITEGTSWFLMAEDHSFSFYWRKKPTMSSKDDFNTDNKLFKIVTRFATKIWDWRGAYGYIA